MYLFKDYIISIVIVKKKVRRHQRSNHKPQIEET